MSNEEIDALNRRARALVDEIWRDQSLWDENFRAAVAVLEEALARAPDDIKTLTNLGADCGRKGDAVRYLERAVALGSRDRHTTFNLAVALLDRDRERAMELFERASALDPGVDTWEAYFDPHGR